MPKRKVINNKNGGGSGRVPQPVSVPRLNPKKYWDHPVYQHLSKRLRIAQERNPAEAAQISLTIQALMSGKISHAKLEELDLQRRELAKADKVERKKQVAHFVPKKKEKGGPKINTTELKKRIFNAQTSKENMVKAFEKLPREDRINVAKSLTPFLRSKIAKYLERKGL